MSVTFTVINYTPEEQARMDAITTWKLSLVQAQHVLEDAREDGDGAGISAAWNVLRAIEDSEPLPVRDTSPVCECGARTRMTGQYIEPHVGASYRLTQWTCRACGDDFEISEEMVSL